MTEKFESNFHKKYVNGEGEVENAPIILNRTEYRGQTFEEIRDHYRKYVGDMDAELPEAILRELRILGKIPS